MIIWCSETFTDEKFTERPSRRRSRKLLPRLVIRLLHLGRIVRMAMMGMTLESLHLNGWKLLDNIFQYNTLVTSYLG